MSSSWLLVGGEEKFEFEVSSQSHLVINRINQSYLVKIDSNDSLFTLIVIDKQYIQICK